MSFYLCILLTVTLPQQKKDFEQQRKDEKQAMESEWQQKLSKLNDEHTSVSNFSQLKFVDQIGLVCIRLISTN